MTDRWQDAVAKYTGANQQQALPQMNTPQQPGPPAPGLPKYNTPTQPGPPKPAGPDRWTQYEQEMRAQGYDFVPWNGTVPEHVGKPLPPINKPWTKHDNGLYQGELDRFMEQQEAKYNEKELPQGAIGWTENGEAFYGGTTPYQEWQLRSQANSRIVQESDASWSDWNAPNVAQSFRDGGVVGGLKSIVAGAVESVNQVNESIDWMLAGSPKAYERVSEPSPAQEAWRNAMYYIKSPAMAVIYGVPYQTKLGIGGISHVARNIVDQAADVYTPQPIPNVQYGKPQESPFWRGIDWKKEYLEGATGGRLLYTTWWGDIKGAFAGEKSQDTLQAEAFKREMRSNPNLNPYLLAMKYENPWAEAIGEAIFDPLNLVEWFAKAGKGAIMTARAASHWGNAMGNVANAMGVTKAAKIAGKLDEVSDVAKIDILAAARIADVNAVRKAEAKLAASKGLFQVTNGAKAHLLAQEVGTVTAWIVRMSKNKAGKFDPDNMFEIMKAIAKTANRADNVDEVKEGLQVLSRFPGWDMVLTEPGTRAASLFTDIVDNPAWYRKLTDTDDIMELLNKVDEKVYKTATDMFPTILQQVKAGKAVGTGWHALAKTHEYLYTKGPYKYFNNLFSGMYLGLNPGYVARNYMQNTVQAFLDEGFKGVVGLDSAGEVARWAGDPTGKLGLQGMKEGFGLAGGEKTSSFVSSLPGLKYGGQVEQFSSVKLYGKIYPETMKKLLRGANVKDNLVNLFNMSVDDADYIARRLIANKGNVDDTFAEIIQAAKDGYVKVLMTDARLADDQITFLNEYSLWDKWYDIIKTSETAEDAQRAWQAQIDEILAWSDAEVVKEIPIGIVGDYSEDIITDAMAAHMSKSISAAELGYQTTFHTANSQAMDAYRTVLSTYRENAIGWMAEAGVKDASKTVDAVLDNLVFDLPSGKYKGRSLLDQTMLSRYKEWVDEAVAKPVRLLIDDARVTPTPEKLAEIWRRAELDKVTGRLWNGDNKDEVVSLLWDKYFAETRKSWEVYRDTYAVYTEQATSALADLVQNSVGTLKQVPDYTLAAKNLKKAQLFDNFLHKNEVFQALAAAKRNNKVSDAAFAWAKQYRLNYFDANGRFVDQRLVNVINKQLGRSFESILDMNGKVTFQEVEQAILAQALGENLKLLRTSGDEAFEILRGFAAGTVDLTEDNEFIIARLLDTLDEVDPRLRNTLDSALNERQMLGALPGSTQSPEEYNRLAKAIETADAEINRAIDEAQDVLRQIDEGTYESVAQRIAKRNSTPPQYTADMTAYSGMNAPTDAQAIHQAKDTFIRMRDEFGDVIDKNFDAVRTVKIDPQQVKDLKKAQKWVQSKVEEARRISEKVSLEKRNFILHDYGKKRNFDLLLSYVMPYHFWYTRTYAAWLQRTVTHPGTIAAYAQYKRALEKVHADMPPWWRYNLSSNELLGLDSKNPFYFNLEASLNPMNGLTGVNFDDDDKRTSWFTKLIDDIGKFGPSVYTPIALGIAYSLYNEGNEEAAAKWAGRIVPQTGVVKALTDIMNRKWGIGGDKWLGGVELDPGVHLFSGGVDIWERGQIARALSWAVDNGEITQAEAQQAAYEGLSNPIFRNAQSIAASQRSAGKLSAFFLGASFKQRPIEDMEIDRMDAEYGVFAQMRSEMSPEEVKDAFLYFQQKYPFFTNIKLSRRDAEERDAAYTYAVMARIPPGQSGRIWDIVGMPEELTDKFYEDKGDMSKWDDASREDFMEAVIAAGMIMEVPPTATQFEWREVKRAYQELQDNLLEQFGPEAAAKKDEYWMLYNDDKELAYAFKDKNPDVAAYMDAEAMGKAYHPLMSRYYNTFDAMASYYKSKAWERLYKQLPPDIHTTLDTYFDMEKGKEKTAYRKAHPEIGKYFQLQETILPEALDKTTTFARWLPKYRPEPFVREEIPEDVPQQSQELLEEVNQRIPMFEGSEMYWASWDNIKGQLDQDERSILYDWAFDELEMPQALEDRLEELYGEPYDLKLPEVKFIIRQAIELRSLDFEPTYEDEPGWEPGQ